MAELPIKQGRITQVKFDQALEVGRTFKIDVFAFETQLVGFDMAKFHCHDNPAFTVVKMNGHFKRLIEGR